jgi:hypothetical protein
MFKEVYPVNKMDESYPKKIQTSPCVPYRFCGFHGGLDSLRSSRAARLNNLVRQSERRYRLSVTPP